MSVFKLSELAGWLHRDERTIRRWCIAGRIKGAFQTKGGHWRVRTEKHGALAASKVMRQLDRSPSEGGKRKFAPRLRNESWKGVKSTIERFTRFHKCGRGKALMHATKMVIERIDQLVESRDERLAVTEKLQEVVWRTPIAPGVMDLVARVAVGIWREDARLKGRGGVRGAAAEAGMARTTFRLHFERYFTEHRYGDRDLETCDLPDIEMTDRERRGWESAARYAF